MENVITFPADTVRLDPEEFYQHKETVRVVDLSQCASLKEIPDFMFQNCELLEKILLPDGLHRVGDMAFAGCPNLKELDIPDSVEIIGTGVLNNSGVKCLRLPASLRSLEHIGDFELLDMSACNSLEAFPDIRKVNTLYLPSELEEIPDGKLLDVEYCHAPDCLKKIGTMTSVGLFCNSPKPVFSGGSRRCVINTTPENESTYRKMADRAGLVREFVIQTTWKGYFFYYLK